MNAIHGTYRDGHVDLDSPVNWAEGARVTVLAPEERVGMTEAEWPDTPEGIADLLARLDAIEPLDLTPEDVTEIRSAREAVREASIEAATLGHASDGRQGTTR